MQCWVGIHLAKAKFTKDKVSSNTPSLACLEEAELVLAKKKYYLLYNQDWDHHHTSEPQGVLTKMKIKLQSTF